MASATIEQMLTKCWACEAPCDPPFTQEIWDARIDAIEARLKKMRPLATLSAYWCPHCFQTEKVFITEIIEPALDGAR